ncbi:MAG: bifunctional indole-3-glycerol phosphate synthase/phosphoribosylanthranilate isomerase [Spirochaetaceae bacterium]|nr:MAG: bifunctional indole-3-glycerol phosphate synthase/phosphoribosylanthranilate isomerase [Spirochaetaceae bacterium]
MSADSAGRHTGPAARPPDILARIARRRRERVAAEGPALGVPIPAERTAPLVPFAADPAVICEVKRRSPSRGTISANADPVAVALRYHAAGIRSVSVLTEEDHFSGSLADLIAVKTAAPDLAVLRKDFLMTVEDIEVSWRAGADAILLIVGMLDDATLAALFAAASARGLATLVEVHTAEELRRAAALKPPLLGMNSRDLVSFRIDRLVPLSLMAKVDWPCRVIFESGLFTYEDARFAANHGFAGVLVGEAAMRAPEVVPDLIRGVSDGRASTASASAVPASKGFWPRLLARRDAVRAREGRPLVKFCGITNRADAEAAVEAGADLLGFVFAPSPRRSPLELPAELADLPVLKVAVVVTVTGPATGSSAGANASSGSRGTGTGRRLPDGVAELLADGFLDAVQFHGDEEPGDCFALAPVYYKALRLRTPQDAERSDLFRSPRVLIDAFDAAAYGGTGKMLADEVVEAAAARLPLWLAGGIGPDNVAQLVQRWQPELVDASSRLETEPGRKDHRAIERFMKEIRNV